VLKDSRLGSTMPWLESENDFRYQDINKSFAWRDEV
jgi:hypothetical protein